MSSDDDELFAGMGAQIFWLIVVALLVLASCYAYAHDAHRPELNEWFDALRANNGELCCTHTEPIIVDDWETKEGHYRIYLEQQWVDVPDEAIVKTPNRAGRAMIWFGYGTITGRKIIRCFMPGTMT